MRVDMFAFMPAMSMSMAVATLTGQNLGAGRPERVKHIFKSGVMMTSSITVLISIIVVTLSRFILIMFGLGEDAKVMEIGIAYLHIAGSCYIFFAIMFISNGVINGAGHTIITMVFTLAVAMARTGSLGMVSVKNKPWNHRNMDCDSMQLFRDNDSQPCLLLLRTVEKISGYQGSHSGTIRENKYSYLPRRSRM